MSAEYRNICERILFLKRSADNIIRIRLISVKWNIGILKKRDTAIPTQKDIAQYRMGLFTPHLL